MAVCVYKNVVRFYVAMNDVGLMRFVKSIRDLNRVVEDFLERQRLASNRG